MTAVSTPTRTAPTTSARDTALRIWRAGLAAANPRALVRARVRRDGDTLHVGEHSYSIAGGRHIWVIGAGKAGESMAAGLEEALGSDLVASGRVSGLVLVPRAEGCPTRSIHVVGCRQGPRNEPTLEADTAARALGRLVTTARPEDLVIGVFSGGGSALLAIPEDGISFDDGLQLTSLMRRAGLPIEAMNILRRHVFQLLGGGLAQRSRAEIVTLLLSDVIGDPPEGIASGPLVPDPSSFEDAVNALVEADLWDHPELPASVKKRLTDGAAGRIPETPKELPHARHVWVGSNVTAVEGAAAEARRLGHSVIDLSSGRDGEAAKLGQTLYALARRIRDESEPTAPPACIVSGGESTVALDAKHGLGGRNMEVALSALVAAGPKGLCDSALVSAGTDGEDGPTDAAGAVVDEHTWSALETLGLDPRGSLARHDAHPLFDAVGSLIRTGPTGTNVADLRVLVVGAPGSSTDPGHSEG